MELLLTMSKKEVARLSLMTALKEGKQRLRGNKFEEFEDSLASDEYVHEYRFWFLEKVEELRRAWKKKRMQIN